PGAGRGRRDAQAGLHGRPGSDLSGHAGKSPERAVLRHPAALDPCHRREAPARAEAKVASACCSPPPCRTRSVPSPRSTCASRSESRQSVLFSATLPHSIRAIAEKHLREPKHVKIAAKTQTVARIEQVHVMVHADQKVAAVCRLL